MKNLDMIMNLLSRKRPKKSQQIAMIALGLATVAGISYIVSTFMESKEGQPVPADENTAAEGDENDRKPAKKVRVAHNEN